MTCVNTSGTHYILVGLESTYATPVIPTLDLGVIQSYSPNEENGTMLVAGSSSREAIDVVSGQYSISPSTNFIFQHGRIFSLLFGGTTTHAQTSSDWKHTYSIGDCLPSFTLEDGYTAGDGAGSRVAGCVVSDVEIKLDLGGTLNITANIKGSKPTSIDGSLTPVISTIPAMSSYFSTLKTGDTGSEAIVGGTVESMSIKINNKLLPVEGHSSRFKTGFVGDVVEILFDFTMSFEDMTEYQKFLGGTSPDTGNVDSQSMIWQITNGVTLGSGRRELYVEFNNFQYSTYNRAVQLGSKVIQSFKGMATTISDFFTVDNISSSAWGV